jgi:diadenosine tetraphosphate (Ap4A) HIT family hydrolase
MSGSPLDDCPFCGLPAARIVAANEQALAVLDAYPVSPGHTLILPRRHVPSFFDITGSELAAIHELLSQMRSRLEAAHKPQGYNVGVNVGRVAGQTVFHTHLHLIPRYAGDVPLPDGGVRNVIPGKGIYR